jgi:bacterial/archaeal transporter family-2 protein
MRALLLTLVVAVGMLLPIQTGINAEFRRHAGHPLLAAALNFAVGGAAIALVAVVLRVGTPRLESLGNAPWWAWFGGFCGATLVVMGIIAAPRIGATLFVTGLVAGQLGASVIFDHFGWVGFEVRPFSATRLLGICLLIGGVLLIQRPTPP